MRNIFLISYIIMSFLQGHFIDDITVNLIHPDGSEFSFLSSGNHYYVRLHDNENNTIIQDVNDGYYYYAQKIDDKVIPTRFRANEPIPYN